MSFLILSIRGSSNMALIYMCMWERARDERTEEDRAGKVRWRDEELTNDQTDQTFPGGLTSSACCSCAAPPLPLYLSPAPWRWQAYAGQLDRTTLPEEFDFRGRWVSNKLDSVLSSATCFTMKSLPSLCCRPYRSDCQRLWMGYVQTVRKRGRSTPFWQQQSGFGIQGNCLFHIIFIVRVRTPACTHHTSCWPTIPVKQ